MTGREGVVPHKVTAPSTWFSKAVGQGLKELLQAPVCRAKRGSRGWLCMLRVGHTHPLFLLFGPGRPEKAGGSETVGLGEALPGRAPHSVGGLSCPQQNSRPLPVPSAAPLPSGSPSCCGGDGSLQPPSVIKQALTTRRDGQRRRWMHSEARSDVPPSFLAHIWWHLVAGSVGFGDTKLFALGRQSPTQQRA